MLYNICKEEEFMKVISRFANENAFLSNFYERPVTYDGLTYRNSEAAFQAQKCQLISEKVAFTTMNPRQAKKAGRSVKLRPDWETVKVDKMYHIVLAKFEQNPDLMNLLLNTGDVYLEEGNTWGDTTWGTVNGHGQNLLGKILMDVRKELGERNVG